jgi:quercetin dioxygenase-like cupin family protein
MSLLQSLQGCPVRVAASVLALVAFGAVTALALEPPERFMPLIATGKTVMDEPIVYPTSAPAKLTTGIVTMLPGAETGWHTHGVPLTGLVLEGELTVDYGAHGKRTYKAGDSLAEAINVPHNGRNTGAGLMRLFVVYIGAEGLPTSIPAKP